MARRASKTGFIAHCAASSSICCGDVFDPVVGGQHVIDVALEDDLMGRKLELLLAEPAVMNLCPRAMAAIGAIKA